MSTIITDLLRPRVRLRVECRTAKRRVVTLPKGNGFGMVLLANWSTNQCHVLDVFILRLFGMTVSLTA